MTVSTLLYREILFTLVKRAYLPNKVNLPLTEHSNKHAKQSLEGEFVLELHCTCFIR